MSSSSPSSVKMEPDGHLLVQTPSIVKKLLAVVNAELAKVQVDANCQIDSTIAANAAVIADLQLINTAQRAENARQAKRIASLEQELSEMKRESKLTESRHYEHINDMKTSIYAQHKKGIQTLREAYDAQLAAQRAPLEHAQTQLEKTLQKKQRTIKRLMDILNTRYVEEEDQNMAAAAAEPPAEQSEDSVGPETTGRAFPIIPAFMVEPLPPHYSIPPPPPPPPPRRAKRKRVSNWDREPMMLPQQPPLSDTHAQKQHKRQRHHSHSRRY